MLHVRTFPHFLRVGSLSALFALFLGTAAHGQTFIMANGASWTGCSGVFYDSGGPGGNYGNSQDLTATLCPTGGSGSGPLTSVLFTSWSVQPGATDQLFIHDGPTTAAPLLATGNGTNSLLNQTITATSASGCLTFRWVSDAANTAPGWVAQVITGPDAGTDGSTTVCSTSAPLSLFSLLGGTPDAGGTWTAPGGGASTGTYDPATGPPGVYTYTVAGTAPCPSDQSTVTVTRVVAPDAGNNGSITVCANTSAFSLFSVLGGSPDPGGTWTAPGGGSSSGTFTPGTSAPGVYTYTVAGTAPCAPDQATVTVTVNALPNAGTNGSTTVCSNAAPFSLFALLGGTPNAGGAWTGPGGGAVSGTYTPGSSTPGVYTYTVTGLPPCLPATATVTVNQVTAPNAGINNAITVCETEAAFSMRSRLNGVPDAGGTWTGPGGGTVPDQFNPATGVSGVYTYTVTGTAPCANATATLSITVRDQPSAGTNGSTTLCSIDADVDLITELGGSPSAGGTWTRPGGAAHSGTFQPGTDPAGVYTYTVAALSPCVNAVATVTVTVNTAPNAGVSASVVRCSDAANFSLRAQLGGTPDLTGSWTAPGGGAHPGTFDPGVDVPGVYTYTVPGLAPCANATSTVSVTIIQAPDAGSNGTLTVCSTDGAFNLLTVLGGGPDANGAWTAPGGGGSSGTFIPGTSAPGVYTYTVTGTAPCANDVATATISVSTAANAGTSGAVTLCSTSSPVNLFTVLGGTPNAGGTWTRPGGGSFGGTYDPANATHPAGTYTYTVTAPAPCPSVSATVQVTENQAPRAGTDGTVTVCSTGSAFNLITALGGSPDANGSWRNPSLQPVPALFTPGTSTPGVYRYVVPGLAPCSNDTSLVTVVVNTAPNAGANGALSICSSAATVNLFTLLGGSPNAGGTWTGPGGGAFGGTYDPANPQHPDGVYTYTVAGLSPCANATAFVVVDEERQPVAGNAASTSVCSDASSFDLFPLLGGTPDNGGSWSAPGGGAASGVFIPGTSTPGAYTYTVSGIAPCTNASAAVTVVVNQAPFAGDDGGLTLCSGQPPVDLFTGLGGTPDVSGTWADTDNTGQLSGSFFDPTGMPAGSYDFTYTVPGSGQCNADQAVVTVTIVPLLDAGTNGTLTACAANTQLDLFTGLGGSPQQGGQWTDLSATGALSGQFFNASVPGPGVYQFKYKLVGTLSCSSDSANVTVTVVAAPNAGINGTAVFCSNSTSGVNLFGFLGGTPQSGGTWRRNNVVVSGIYTPQTDSPGTYTYTVTGTPPCANAVSSVTVSEVTAPNAGVSDQITKCSSDAQFSMRSELGGTPSPLGTWTDPLGAAHGDIFQPGLDLPGIYIHTVAGTTPCPAATATLTITVNPAAYAGNSASTTVCSSDPPFLLFSRLGGAPAPNGTWTAPGGTAFPSGLFTPGTSTPGVYTYTVAGTAPCAAAQATVTVFVVPEADAGSSSSVTLCSGSGAVNLFAFLGGTPDPTGTWTTSGGSPFSGVFVPGTTPPGVFSYTVVGTAPCSTATATVTVAVSQPPSAGNSSSHVACSTDPPFALVDKLGGTPALNGTWTGPGGVASNGIFTPGSSTPGIYTYTVPGTAPCGPSTATVNVLVNPAANAGCAGTLTLCSTSAATSLFGALGCAPQPGGVWRRPGNVPHSGTFLPAIDPPGVYTYIVAGTAPCSTATATVTVTVNQVPNAGCNGLVTICDNATPFPLLNVLGCGPQLNGTWTAPGGQAHSGVFIPGVDQPGGYTYSIPGTAPCTNSTAVVTVVVNPSPDAGTDAVVTVCSDQQPFLLYDELGGTPDIGGAWSAPGGGAFTGVFIPGTSAGGVYTYVLNGLSPCINDTSRVTVVQNIAPDAGVSTATLICSDAPPVSLIDVLLGTPDANGSWTGPGGGAHTGVFVAGTDAPGVYTYTVPGFAPCATQTASVQVSVTNAPSAGGDGALTTCVDNTALDLFTGLAGTYATGGTWADDDNSGGLTGSVLNTTGVPPGVYAFTYTVPGNAPCSAASAVVTVTVTNALNAGADSTVQVCESETAYILFTGLAGAPQPGGQWVDVDGSGAMVNGAFNASQAGVGVFRFDYVLPSSATCPSASATVTVQVAEGPYAGTDGFTSLCSNAGQVNMFTLLGGGPDAGGTWTGPSSQPTDAFFDPAVDAAGSYTYTVPAVGNCAADQAVVTVQVVAAPDAGDPGTLTICSNGATVLLIDQLLGTPQAGGAWTGPGGSPHPGSYNPAVDVQGVYTYTVAGQGVCANDQAVVVVAENVAPFAGLDNSISICSDEAPFALITRLAGNPQTGGSWTGPGGVPVPALFDPAAGTSGVYTYTVNGLTPCVPDVALLTIQVTQSSSAGADSTLGACSTNAAVDLFLALGPDADSGGSWTDVNATGALVGNVFDATQVALGTYSFIYTVAGSGPCPGQDATITVVVGAGGDPGIGGADTICGGTVDYNMFNSLGGTPDHDGVWGDVLGTGALQDSILNASLLPINSQYPFTYTVTTPGCGSATSTVFITVTPFPDPGGDTVVFVCVTAPPFDLFTLLPGTPDPGGSWTVAGGAPVSSTFDPATSAPGTYYYNLSGLGACSDTTAIVSITVNQPPVAGADGAATVCNTDSVPYVLAEAIAGEQAGGAWADLDGAGGLSGGLFDPEDVPPASYTFRYVVTVPGCGTDTSLAEITVNEAVSVSDTVFTCIDKDRTFVVAFTLIDGDPASYVVTGVAGTLSATAPYVFTSVPLFNSQAYAITVTDANGCSPLVISGTSPCENDEPLYVPESFSPNGDGINDVLLIPGIEGFPENVVSIYNRWGDEVYRAAGYDNRTIRWDGTSENAALPGDLPTGTYYYVVEPGDGGDVYKGFIYLNR